jgi:hypothetical protein
MIYELRLELGYDCIEMFVYLSGAIIQSESRLRIFLEWPIQGVNDDTANEEASP